MLTETRHARTSQNINTSDDAFAYIVECTLATVSDLASKRRPPKGELSRQISIAQTGLDWVRTLMSDPYPTGNIRLDGLINANKSVQHWVDEIRSSL